jgi:transcriptional regulator with XRE-family HTH domain
MSELSVVARRLKEARMRADLSQGELGVKAGMDKFSASARISQYEHGKHMPDLQTLTRLANVLRMPVPYFYCDDPELAELIARFSELSKAQRRRALRLLET